MLDAKKTEKKRQFFFLSEKIFMGRGKLSKIKSNEVCMARLEIKAVAEQKKKNDGHVKVREVSVPDLQTKMLSRMKIMEMLENSKDLCPFDFDNLQEVWSSSSDSDFKLVDHTSTLVETRDNAIADTVEGVILHRMQNVYIYMAKDYESSREVLNKQMFFLAKADDIEINCLPAVWIAEVGPGVVFGYHDMNVFDTVIKIKNKMLGMDYGRFSVDMMTQGLIFVYF